MTEPTRFSTPPIELPLRLDPEPTPAEDCTACSWLANMRAQARAKGDMAKVSDYNVLLRRHAVGHR